MSVGVRIRNIAFSAASIGLILYGDKQLTLIGIEDWLAQQNVGRSQFLTIVAGVYGSMLAHLSIIVDQFFGTQTTGRIARSLTLLALPANITITLIYWPLYLFLSHLISSNTEVKLPLLTDLLIHFIPGVSLLIYTIFIEDSRRVHLFGKDLAKFITMALVYISWVEYKAFVNADKLLRYPYPFLNIVGNTERISIYFLATAISWLIFVSLNRWAS